MRLGCRRTLRVCAVCVRIRTLTSNQPHSHTRTVTPAMSVCVHIYNRTARGGEQTFWGGKYAARTQRNGGREHARAIIMCIVRKLNSAGFKVRKQRRVKFGA